MGSAPFQQSITSGQRFRFGKNWQEFLSTVTEENFVEADRSLQTMLGMDTLRGMTFLDVGSGSGLFSLAAMRLGAARVHSFDFDPQSVACAHELRQRYYPDSNSWSIERGDALNANYLAGLGQWDVVYSWGVLHHTGNMWSALANVANLVRADGLLFVSIYNDQGFVSKGWTQIKRIYNRSLLGRLGVVALFVPYFALRPLIADLVRRRNPLTSYTQYKKMRGMSRVHDWIDWLGGYPFEVAKPEEIFSFFQRRGYELVQLKTCAGNLGCNEFVFRKQ